MSSNARKIPAEVLSHPAVVSLIDRARPSGRVTPEEVRQATEQAAVEPRHLKALLGHLSTLGISVDLGAPIAKAAAATSATKKTTTAKTAAKKAPAKAADAAPATKDAPASDDDTDEPDLEDVDLDDLEIEDDAESVDDDADDATTTVGPDGKKVLPDISDEQFEKDVASDPTIAEDEKEASFVV